MSRPPWFLAIALFLASIAPLPAQDLARQPTAFTAWLDFQSQTVDLPIWIEKVDKQTIKGDGSEPAKTAYRIRFRHFPGLVDDLSMRVYFQDTPNAEPVVSAWSEIGTRLVGPVTLGQGLGFPASETVAIPMAGVDYVDIETPGDGWTVRGVLALALRKAVTAEGLDFGGTAAVTDPFGNAQPSISGSNDTLLFGRVKATLEPGVVSLGNNGDSGGQAAAFDFALAKAPLIALLTFEILNADISLPPQISVNGKDAGAANMLVTDLADPALTGAIEAARPDAVYRYGGWLKCQKVIPGSLLTAGTNNLLISASTSVAIRAIEVQLKYTQDASSP